MTNQPLSLEQFLGNATIAAHHNADLLRALGRNREAGQFADLVILLEKVWSLIDEAQR